MDTFKDFLETMRWQIHRERTEEVLGWVHATFPQLDTRIAWNIPTFTHHGTFIVSFNPVKAQLDMAPEDKTLQVFAEEIKAAGFTFTRMMLRLPWNKPVPYELLERMIAFNIEDKKDVQTFWRPKEDLKA